MHRSQPAVDMVQEKDYYAEGIEASLNGISALHCPYDEGTDEQEMWFIGWQETEKSKEK